MDKNSFFSEHNVVETAASPALAEIEVKAESKGPNPVKGSVLRILNNSALHKMVFNLNPPSDLFSKKKSPECRRIFKSIRISLFYYGFAGCQAFA